MKRVVAWLIVNSGLAYILYLALIESSEKAGNLLKFAVIFTFAITLIGFSSKTARESAAKRGPSVPKWVNWAYGLCFAGMLAYHGWFIYATLDILTTIFQLAIYEKQEDKE